MKFIKRVWVRKLKSHTLFEIILASSQEMWFFMKEGQRFQRVDETRETSKLTATSEVDSSVRDVLVSDDGMFKAGLLPAVSGVTTQGAKHILDIVGQASFCMGGFVWHQKNDKQHPTTEHRSLSSTVMIQHLRT